MIIRLTQWQLDHAFGVALWRNTQAFERGQRQRHSDGGFDKNFAKELLGSCCELAAKIYLNPIYWWRYEQARRRRGEPPVPDLGKDIDVKGIDNPDHSLIVQYDAPPDWVNFLVDGSAKPGFRMIGWRWGHEAQEPQFRSDAHNACLVRQSAGLRAPGELLEMVRREDAAAA